MKRTLILFATLTIAIQVSGCVAGPGGGLPLVTPGQSVYVLEGAYASALRGAVAYRALPRCGTGSVLCHDPVVVGHLIAADAKAHDAVAGVETIVRSQGSTAQVAAAIATAQILIADFTALVPKQ